MWPWTAPATSTSWIGTTIVSARWIRPEPSARSPAKEPRAFRGSALGINTYNTNTGVATDTITGALLTYTNSGTPGETIVLRATGLGAGPADSDNTYTLTPYSVNTPLRIYIDGVLSTVLYAGSAGYPALPAGSGGVGGTE
jgi:uncharacterized protein (TIGR03437 family)